MLKALEQIYMPQTTVMHVQTLQYISSDSHHPWCSQTDADLWWLVSPPPDSCMYDCVQAPKSISPTIVIPPHASAGRCLPRTRTTQQERMWLNSDCSRSTQTQHCINTVTNLPTLIYRVYTDWEAPTVPSMRYFVRKFYDVECSFISASSFSR